MYKTLTLLAVSLFALSESASATRVRADDQDQCDAHGAFSAATIFESHGGAHHQGWNLDCQDQHGSGISYPIDAKYDGSTCSFNQTAAQPVTNCQNPPTGTTCTLFCELAAQKK